MIKSNLRKTTHRISHHGTQKIHMHLSMNETAFYQETKLQLTTPQHPPLTVYT